MLIGYPTSPGFNIDHTCIRGVVGKLELIPVTPITDDWKTPTILEPSFYTISLSTETFT